MSRQQLASIVSNTPVTGAGAGTGVSATQPGVEPGHFLMILQCPEVAARAQPGQFVHVRCSPYHDPLLRRPLSVADVSDDRTRLSLLVREVGKGTAILARTAVGSALDILGPLGRGYTLDVGKDDREFVLVAGGYGVAPIHFAARRLRGMRGRLGRPRLSVFLGAATAERLVFAGRLKRLADDLHLVTEDGSVGHQGLVTDPLARYLETSMAHRLEGQVARVLACGPMGMMAEVARLCEHHGMPCEVSLENWMGCGVGACLGCVVPARGTDAADAFRPIEQGRMAQEEESVLDGHRYLRVCTDGPVFEARDIAWEAMR